MLVLRELIGIPTKPYSSKFEASRPLSPNPRFSQDSGESLSCRPKKAFVLEAFCLQLHAIRKPNARQERERKTCRVATRAAVSKRRGSANRAELRRSRYRGAKPGSATRKWELTKRELQAG